MNLRWIFEFHKRYYQSKLHVPITLSLHSNFSFLGFGLFKSLFLVFSGYWPFNQFICDIWNILDHIFCITSISTVVYISAERFLSIKYPLKHKSVLTKMRSIVHLFSIWAINTGFWSLYIGLTQYYFSKQRDLNQCSVYFLNYTGFALFNATATLILPVVTTSILYVCIYDIARKNSTFRKDLHAATRGKLKR